MPRDPCGEGGDAGATKPLGESADLFDRATEDADGEGSPSSAGERDRDRPSGVTPRWREVDALGPHRSVGPYRILGVLGRGGMGVVYRGEHQETGEPAAVKTVHATAEMAVSSIRREIHALGRLRHPGIVRIMAEGISRGRPWY